MPDIDAELLAQISGVLQNTWAVELPPDPVFPAAVFEVESEPEQGWVSYGQAVRLVHTVTVVVLAMERAQAKSISAAIRRVLEGSDYFVQTQSFGDADYERDSSVFGRHLTVVFRT